MGFPTFDRIIGFSNVQFSVDPINDYVNVHDRIIILFSKIRLSALF
jgi:hypothetical protein